MSEPGDVHRDRKTAWELFPYSWAEVPEDIIPWNWQTYYLPRLSSVLARESYDRRQQRLKEKRRSHHCIWCEGDDIDLDSIK